MIWVNMNDQERQTKSSNKKIALVLGGIALAWYVVSMFSIWHQ
jgi:hypothetical protein